MRILFGIIFILAFFFVSILALKIVFAILAILFLPYPLFSVLPFVFMYDTVFYDGRKLILTAIVFILIILSQITMPYIRK